MARKAEVESELVEAELVESPKAAMSGHFAIYLTDDGRAVVACRIDGEKEPIRRVIPAPMLAMLKTLAETSPDSISLGQVFSALVRSRRR